MLNAELKISRKEFSLDVILEANGGDVIGVVGPNGAGKTTLLRALAGLEPLTKGHIVVDGDEWENASKRYRRNADARSAALVLSDPLLFPHMSAIKNIAFGLKAHGVSTRNATDVAAGWLDRLGLADYADRRPGTLSTGQQQRVSLARALAVEPKLLLLDEPLSAQDASVRSALRAELRQLLSAYDGVVIVVTHDAVDAMTLANRLMVLESGRVVQSGSPSELAARPSTTFVAQMVGLNLFRGWGNGHVVSLTEGGELSVADAVLGPVLVAFSPRAVALAVTAPSASAATDVRSSPRNRWTGTVSDLQHVHGRVRVQLAGPPEIVSEVTPAAATELDLAVGQRVSVSVKATEIEVYPG